MSTAPEPQALRIFVSYASEDQALKDRITAFLQNSEPRCELLSSELLRPGENRREALGAMYRDADAYLLLLSPAYLRDERMAYVELSQLRELAAAGMAELLPFLLQPCAADKLRIGSALLLPEDGRAWSEYEYDDQVLRQLQAAVEDVAMMRASETARNRIATERQAATGRLDLSGCGLTAIPRAVRQFRDLESLDLHGNRISTISGLEKLTQLRDLHLSGNEIRRAEGLSALGQLMWLDLQQNHIETLEGHDIPAGLIQLNVSENRLSTLTGIEKVQGLKNLFASTNQIIDLSALSALPGLERLHLQNNHFASIRSLLPMIRAGIPVQLEGNMESSGPGIFLGGNAQLAEPPLEVVARGNSAILDYFGAAAVYGTRRLEVLKLVLVGNSGAGKTNLCELLLSKPRTPAHQSTHLLEIHPWEAPRYPSTGAGGLRINIFDFGGQDYYHDSHRLFYSHDTLYILVWEGGTNRYSEVGEARGDGSTGVYENYPLEYWLESIVYNLGEKYRPDYAHSAASGGDTTEENRGRNAPIFILQNKIDLGERLLDQARLAAAYPNISGFFSVSLAEGRRTALLPEILEEQLAKMNLAGRELVTHEYHIVMSYLQQPRPYALLSLARFCEDCRALIADDAIPFSLENAAILADVLTALGILFFDKRGDNDGLVFTQVTALNEGIREVMRLARDSQQSGTFSMAGAAAIPYQTEILDLLVRNKSIVALGGDRYLAPQFLPASPDSATAFFLHAFSHHNIRYVYKAYFHKTLLLSLFADYLGSGSAAGLPFWRDGIVISRGEGAGRELVLVEFLKTETAGLINLKSMQPYRSSGLVREVEMKLEKLNAGWTVEKEVSANGLDFFPVQQLLEAVEDGQHEFAMNDRLYTVSDFKEIVTFRKVPKKLFISYSSKNGAFMKRFGTHLEVLRRAGHIEPWYDRMIEGGSRWDDAIKREMDRADIILFLLSPDFLATDYIMETEVTRALELQQQKKDRVSLFFVELQPCSWESTPISSYQQLFETGHADKKVLSIGNPENDAEWKKVLRLLGDLTDPKPVTER